MVSSFAPKARDSTLEPPTPIDIPIAPMKKETGKTTFIAAKAVGPIQFPTKILSTKIFSDIASIPIEAGIACLINKDPIGFSPSSFGLALAIKKEV